MNLSVPTSLSLVSWDQSVTGPLTARADEWVSPQGAQEVMEELMPSTMLCWRGGEEHPLPGHLCLIPAAGAGPRPESVAGALSFPPW